MARKPKEPLKYKTDTRPFGRPSLYTPEMVELICEKVSKHSWGLPKLCAHYPELPDVSTINDWRSKYDDFSDKYLLAKKKQTHLIADDMLETNEELKDYIYIDPVSGAQKIDSGIIAMFNLQNQTKKWHVARLNPRYYGDKTVVENTTSQDESIREELQHVREKLRALETRDN